MKAKISKWDTSNEKASVKQSKTTNKMKRQPMELKKIFANHI